jgi:lysozyme
MMTKTNTPAEQPTPFRNLVLLLLLLSIPFWLVIKAETCQYAYNNQQCPPDRRKTYRHFDAPIPPGYAIHGIDVSHYSCPIDWQKVAQMNANGMRVHFAYMRATYGLTLVDYQLADNWRQAREAGVRRGAYHFFTFSDNASEQARFFLNQVRIEKGDLPPVLDIENDKVVNDRRLNRAEILRGIQTWLDIVESETGVRAMIYSNLDYYRHYLSGNFPNNPIWIASYNNLRGVNLPDGKPWWFWQFSEKGRCNGISEPIDLNVFRGNEAQLDAILKK